MQWTDESGSSYGTDPYGSTHSYPYAPEYGDECGAHATADTVAMPWAPERFLPWDDQVRETYGEFAYETYRAESAWDGPHTVRPPGYEPSSPDTSDDEATQPVFVDSSGRRQRRVRRAARLLVIPAGGYMALLASTLLGGPALSSAFVPLPDPPSPTPHPSVAAPDASPRPTPSARSRTTAKSTSVHVVAARPKDSAAPPATTSTPTPWPSTAAPAPKATPRGRSHKPLK
ncbi:hypothetical protein ACFOSC_00685 [Streptantibioticus rubrisoli]|uniref:Uncharacterized protein n=1 Tax=Streptantibioticus rubrisoli TaxID=1387313 RepID=A0ABT1PDA6_9ACTN|nr:hypothetical protein [Streptantibioticus rubrisoli]MCQ4043352.1 hypothetical protein [Streptantibioticus rubrisoli]